MSSTKAAQFAEIVIVRVLSSGGPYAVGDVLSVAFTTPEVGRLRAHEASAWADVAGTSEETADDAESPRVPDVISALVLSPAGPYHRDEVIDLGFVDPSLARIHRPHFPGGPDQLRTSHAGSAGRSTGRALHVDSSSAPSEAGLHAHPRAMPPPPGGRLLGDLGPQADGRLLATLEPQADARPATDRPLRDSQASIDAAGVSVHLRWTPDRVRRFVQVSDKLFTVERLGWYRHALVLRLLVPDAVRCDDQAAAREASEHLAALREAVAESLGNPLLAAFMPNFAVTADWLESIETAEIARELAAFRGAVAPHLTTVARHATAVVPNLATDNVSSATPLRSGEETVALLTREELLATPFSSIEAGLALIVPHVAAAASLAEPLGAYRAKLAELFGQMADTPEKARLKTMTQSNHALDDLLWQLVSGVQQTFEPAPAA